MLRLGARRYQLSAVTLTRSPLLESATATSSACHFLANRRHYAEGSGGSDRFAGGNRGNYQDRPPRRDSYANDQSRPRAPRTGPGAPSRGAGAGGGYGGNNYRDRNSGGDRPSFNRDQDQPRFNNRGPPRDREGGQGQRYGSDRPQYNNRPDQRSQQQSSYQRQPGFRSQGPPRDGDNSRGPRQRFDQRLDAGGQQERRPSFRSSSGQDGERYGGQRQGGGGGNDRPSFNRFDRGAQQGQARSPGGQYGNQRRPDNRRDDSFGPSRQDRGRQAKEADVEEGDTGKRGDLGEAGADSFQGGEDSVGAPCEGRNEGQSRRRDRVNAKKAPALKEWWEEKKEKEEEAPPPEPKQKKVKAFKPVAVVEKAKEVFLPQVISVSNLSRLLGVKLRSLQRVMEGQALSDTRPDALLSFDDSSLLCAEYNLEAISDDEAAFDIYPALPPPPSQRASLPYRPPVVAVMGHVDHGKTSLLDRLRSASVAAGEAGGITQHIGAFSVPVKSAASSDAISAVSKITFLDTPGHAAFSNMRARGAKVTDIVVLVVAADDGVMTQTKEVIGLYQSLEAEAAASAEEERKEAEAAEVEGEAAAAAATAGSSTTGAQRKKQNNIQLIVAVSKCDRPEANVQRVKEQLGSEGIYVEDLGGDVPCVEISSKTGDGFEEFEETLAAMAELGDLRAPVEGPAEGLILESRTEKGKGNTATVLVTRGSLKAGDCIIAGKTWAKVRQMVDSNGQNVKATPPGEAVLVSGWKELPSAGDEVLSAAKEEEIKKAVANRLEGQERKKMMQVAIAVNESRRKAQEEENKEALLEQEERERRRAQRLAESEGRVYEETKEAGTAEEGEEGADVDSDIKELRLVVKSDFSGTGEALVGALAGIGTKGARIKLLSVGVGEINEADVNMARALGGHILGFNVKAPRKIQDQVDALNKVTAGQGGVHIYSSPVIYQILEYVTSALVKLLPPVIETRVLGEATVAQVFSINVKSRQFTNIAGCRITNGTVKRDKMVRVMRRKGRGASGGDVDGADEPEREAVWQGNIDSLKHVKKEVQEMRKGTECGISFEGFQAFQQGDIVQSIELVEVPRTL